MKLELKQFLNYENIIVQCHNNPDADAIASGFAVLWYLRSNGKQARFVYGGEYQIKKSNLTLMISTLNIPIDHVTALDAPDLLITVDCQYGENNVEAFPYKTLAIIDHHQIVGELPEMSDIRSNYGSCSTVVYKLLEAEGISINKYENLATALYYGLLTDTNNFAEIHHPADKDLRDSLHYKKMLITQYKNSNLSIEELVIAGEALKHTITNTDYRYAIVEAKPCDPNILGMISDMVLEVDSIDVVLAYSILPFGIKLSLRSCIASVQASELAEFLTFNIGGGGGHLFKAGGFIQKDLIEKLLTSQNIELNNDSIRSLISERMQNYYKSSQVIYANEYIADIDSMEKYTKKPLKMGYVPSITLGKEGEKILVRTVEGDVDISISNDVYILIGINGEIYPSKAEPFSKNYTITDNRYSYNGDYPPTVINSVGDRIDILPFSKECISTGTGQIYAKKLTSRVKVFTAWDEERYYLGKPGDYLAVRADNPSDVYIITKKHFNLTYE